jgi:single-strand DNA-binding protein
MANYNKVLLMGNLTRDPQLKYLPSQTAVAEFGLAINRRYKTQAGEDRDETTFVDCSAFGRTGEVINQYFTKGKPIFVEGRLKFDSWEDKNGGGKRSRLTVFVERFEFVGGRDGGAGGGGAPGGYDSSAQGGGGSSGGGGGDEFEQRPSRPAPQSRPMPQQNRPAPQQRPQPQQPPAEQPFGEEQAFKEDDIPF